MKKLLTIIIASAVVSGCCNGHNHRSVMQGTSDLTAAKIVEIDSCEYIQFNQDMYAAITHKGNCKYCLKRQNEKNLR